MEMESEIEPEMEMEPELEMEMYSRALVSCHIQQ